MFQRAQRLNRNGLTVQSRFSFTKESSGSIFSPVFLLQESLHSHACKSHRIRPSIPVDSHTLDWLWLSSSLRAEWPPRESSSRFVWWATSRRISGSAMRLINRINNCCRKLPTHPVISPKTPPEDGILEILKLAAALLNVWHACVPSPGRLEASRSKMNNSVCQTSFLV